MNQTSALFEFAYAIYLKFAYFLSTEQKYAALVLALVLGLAGVVIHELGHLVAARCFGVPATIKLFPRSTEQGSRRKFRLRGPLGVVTDDDHYFALSRWRRRVIIGAGPAVDAVVGLMSLLYGLSLPVAPWAAIGVALSGAMVLVLRMCGNLIPMRCLENDGWQLIDPDCQIPMRR